jgi:hypothetical protein
MWAVKPLLRAQVGWCCSVLWTAASCIGILGLTSRSREVGLNDFAGVN